MIRFLQTPGPLKKVILGGMLLVICGAMVVTLIPGGLGSSLGLTGPGRGVIARVSGEEVTTLDVQRVARQMVQQQFPRGGAQASMLLPFFAQRAADQLINEKVALAEAQHLGLRATDADVRDELQHGRYAATFFPSGKFIGENEYQQLLQQHDLTVPVFEQGVKDEILFDKLRTLVAGSAAVSPVEVRKQFEKQSSKVKFEYAVLRKDDLLKGIHPSESELKAFYDRNKGSYNNSIPEKRQLKYVVIDTSSIAAQTPVSQQDLQAYYDQHRDDYRQPEQVNVRHILIKGPLPGPDGKVDQKAADEARKKAEDVLKQVKAGGNFADLARKFSEDPGSAKNGGSLGPIGRGRTVPEFEKAAFSLPKGGTSDLVQSSYGFHIIHVDDKQEAHLKSLEEVRAQIEPTLKQQKATQAAESQANGLLAQAKNQGLDKAAAAKGLHAVATDFVSRTDSLPGIGNAPQFMDAVFSAREKSPPDQAPLPQGFAIYEVLASKPVATPTFEEIRSRVENEFKNERSTSLLTQKTQELADRAKAGHDLKKAAKELGATVKTSDLVLPDGQVPDLGAMSGPPSVAFTLKPGEISGPVSSGSNGAVLAVLEKQEPSDQDFSSKKDQVRDALLQNKQAEAFGIFVTGLRDQMEKSGKIKINQDEMKGLTKGQGSLEGG